MKAPNSFFVSLPACFIRVQGTDASKFLQGQLTCDIQEITQQQSRLSAYCNHKGKVLSIFRLFFFASAYYLYLPDSMLETTLTTLKKYAVFSKVTLEKAPDFTAIGLLLANEQTLLKNFPSQILDLKIDQTVLLDDLIFIRVSDKNFRYEIYGSTNKLNKLASNLTETGISPETSERWQLENIQEVIPTIYPETSEQFTPHMLNLSALHAVSFTKGCYLGQEIIARTEHLGATKRQLKHLVINSNKFFKPGDKIFDDQQQEVGTVIASVHADSQNSLLAVTYSEQLRHFSNVNAIVIRFRPALTKETK